MEIARHRLDALMKKTTCHRRIEHRGDNAAMHYAAVALKQVVAGEGSTDASVAVRREAQPPQREQVTVAADDSEDMGFNRAVE
jgi:hypothetical protein